MYTGEKNDAAHAAGAAVPASSLLRGRHDLAAGPASSLLHRRHDLAATSRINLTPDDLYRNPDSIKTF